MPFDPEVVYVLLEGGSVLPISGVTDEYTPTDVEIYDGETYRNEINAAFMGTARTLTLTENGGNGFIIANGGNISSSSAGGAFTFATTNDPHLEKSDSWTATPPWPLKKTRTIWSFPRGTGYTHTVWADLVQGTSPLPPYRLGNTPTAIPTS